MRATSRQRAQTASRTLLLEGFGAGDGVIVVLPRRTRLRLGHGYGRRRRSIRRCVLAYGEDHQHPDYSDYEGRADNV